MLSNAIGQIRTGIDGWMNTLVRNSDIELMAGRRMAACDSCEHRGGMICGLCGCPLAAKTRARDASCPDGRW